ncbi:cytochrome c oxidase assembly protein COX16, mitochondrial-like [Dendronephthya gigantea]|uniref:cytochrome c oxidase assembly protein COX16, mitochondrial-like n=1 Tax=Dendronephthya gigantea TaxID=151771 RepID=UPI00106C7E41|nr:cytochrome c oxidase assembly protein COX16, mitochondrial-like [Dendronephthya gigantea]
MAAWSWVFWMKKLSSGQRSFLKFGMPMVLLVVLGSVGLSEFTEIKMKKRDEKVRKLNYEETQKFHVRRKEKPLTLEDAYKEVQGMDIGDWENKRVPRPWSEDK